MNIESFLKSPDPAIVTAAVLVNSAAEQFKAEQLSEQEYKEIIDNILDYDRIIGLTATMERQTEVAIAFEQLKDIAGVLMAL